MGYVDRFAAFLTQFLETKFIVPIQSVTSNADDPSSIPGKLSAVVNSNAVLQSNLDSVNQNMVSSVDSAWSQDQSTVADLVAKTSTALRDAESNGVAQINSEMSQMYNKANQAVTDNLRLIDNLGKTKMRDANNTAKSVLNLANYLWRGTNQTLDKANKQFVAMNATMDAITAAKADLTTKLAQIQTDVTNTTTQKFLQAQNQTGYAQLVASQNVDSTLAKMAQDVTQALQSLTNEEKRNLTNLSTYANQAVQTLTNKINGYTSDAQRRSSALQSTYSQQLATSSQSTSALFTQIDQNMAAVTNEVTRANNSVNALSSYVDQTFSNLDNSVSSLFQNQSQLASSKKTDLGSWMDQVVGDFKVAALNASQDGSQQLQDAYQAAVGAVTSGSNALSMTFEQRQQIINQLKNWQQQYQGNTNKLVTAFQSTYGGLINDTNNQLQSAIGQQQGQISAAQAQQAQLIQQALAAANGDPAQLQQVLAKFGIVGSQAAAAIAQIQGDLGTAQSGISNGLNDGLTALSQLLVASQANQGVYSQAGDQNAQAASTAGDAVQNVTARLAVMNSMMKTYSDQISSALFQAQNNASQAISDASSAQNANVTANIQAKMSEVQALLSQAIQSGQTSASQIAQFAAQIGANATALQQLVDSMQSGSSDGLAQIAQTSSDSINNLKTQVGAQLAASGQDFDNNIQNEQSSLQSLIQGMQSDISTQSGQKTQLLLQKRDFLQNLYGQLTSSSVARSQAGAAMDKQFTDIQNQVTAALPNLSAQIAAQQSRVASSLSDKQNALTAASTQVNQTIADTNATAISGLQSLQDQGQQKIDSIQAALNDSTGAINMMVSKYQAQMQQYLDQDSQDRVDENAQELDRIMGVNTTLTQSSQSQSDAFSNQTAANQARAAQLASIIGDLSDASAAAKGGQASFQTYIQDLAQKNGISMALLVSAMKDQAADHSSALSQMLASNGLFVDQTLQGLSDAASQLQQGAVDGSTDVLNQITGSSQTAQGVSATQTGQLNDLSDQTGDLVAISGQQLTTLMTILLAQNEAQSAAANSQYQSALNQTANVQTAINMYTQAMNQATQADVDALTEASDVTDAADAAAKSLVDAAIATATDSAKQQTDQADSDFAAIESAIQTAGPIMQGYAQRLDTATQTFNNEKTSIEGQVSDLQQQVTDLQNQVSSSQQAQMDKVSSWIANMQTSALSQLTQYQQAAATTTPAPQNQASNLTAALGGQIPWNLR